MFIKIDSIFFLFFFCEGEFTDTELSLYVWAIATFPSVTEACRQSRAHPEDSRWRVVEHKEKGGFSVAQQVKNLLAMHETQETQIRSLGQDDLLEEGMATHFSILAWRIP